MDDVHVPEHQLHLEPKDCWIVAVVQENESDGITIRHPNKSRTEQRMAILADCPIPREALTEV